MAAKIHTTQPLNPDNALPVNKAAPLVHDRDDDEVRNRHSTHLLSSVLAKFAPFSGDFLNEGRGDHQQAERDGLT